MNYRMNINLKDKRIIPFGLLAFRETEVPVLLTNFDTYDPTELTLRLIHNDVICAELTAFTDNGDGTATGLLNLNTVGFEDFFKDYPARASYNFTLILRSDDGSATHLLVNDYVAVINNPDSDDLDSPTYIPSVIDDNPREQSIFPYTLIGDDRGRTIWCNSIIPAYVTIPSDASSSILVNSKIHIVQFGVGSITVRCSIGVILNGVLNSSLVLTNQFSFYLLVKRSANNWVLSGL